MQFYFTYQTSAENESVTGRGTDYALSLEGISLVATGRHDKG